MLFLAAGRVSEPHRWRVSIAAGAVVAHIGLQARRAGLAVAWSEHRQRRVSMQFRCGEDVAAQCIDQGTQQRASGADPAGQ